LKRVYIALAVVAVLVWVAIGLLVAKGPQPEIIVPAESLFMIGPLHVTNTLLTAWVVMLLVIGISLLATKSMKLMPSGIQNFVEAVVDFLVSQVEDIAGHENGRRFFMVIATFFIFIIASNWFGLLPFFNSIGKTDDVGHEIFTVIQEHQASGEAFAKTKKYAGWKMQDTSGIVMVKPGGSAVDFEVEANANASDTLDRYIVFLAKNFAGFKAEDDQLAAPSADTVKAAAATLTGSASPQLLLAESKTAEGVPSPALGQTISGVDFSNSQKMALVVPFFRGVYSDVNNTLALGICSFIVVEFWGFQALGFGYLKKFFNLNGIMSFVGILELLSEFIRIISFTFRLFGNIFAGEVLILMLTFLMPFLFVDVIYGLELFVGFIQAAVFALLTLVFASMAVESHDEEHHEGHPGESTGGHQPEAAQAH
jgi:F-type H+-transporting ATPase subunit a